MFLCFPISIHDVFCTWSFCELQDVHPPWKADNVPFHDVCIFLQQAMAERAQRKKNISVMVQKPDLEVIPIICDKNISKPVNEQKNTTAIKRS